jgi:hypothetical protein
MPQWRRLCAVPVALWAFAGSLGVSYAQQHIGSTILAKNDVTRELSGASAPLTAGENVFRNEIVKTGVESTAKLVFLDSTNLGVGPVSRVTLDQFVYVGDVSAQRMAINLTKGVFRFTTGTLDKERYIISTPNAGLGIRGTVLDIGVQGAQSKVTLVEGQALVCPRRPGLLSPSRSAIARGAQADPAGRAASASTSTTRGRRRWSRSRAASTRRA